MPHTQFPKTDPRAWVVHCQRSPYDVYIGRDNPRLGLRDIGFSNRYSHKPMSRAEFRVATRDEAVERFQSDTLADLEFMERIRRELKGKILGCWCAPKRCHGEVLAAIANGLIVPERIAAGEQIALF